MIKDKGGGVSTWNHSLVVTLNTVLFAICAGTTWAKRIRKASDLLVHLLDHCTEPSWISPEEREKFIAEKLDFSRWKNLWFPTINYQPRVFKDTELGGYSVKYNLRYPGKYLHLNALWSVVQLPRVHCPLSHFGHSRKGNCFCQYP